MIVENEIAKAKKNLITDENNDYIELYKGFQDEELKSIFSTIHNVVIESFESMNTMLPTDEENSHYWADNSRRLLNVINVINDLYKNLKNTKYSFAIDDYYEKLFKKCLDFLNLSGGSSIPPKMDTVNIYYVIPIFLVQDKIRVNSNNEYKSFSLKHIGKGSYANVHYFKDTNYDLKIVRKKANDTLTKKELIRFKNEFKVTKKLNSPYVIDVYKYNDSDNSYTMEYCDTTLEKFISKQNNQLSMEDRIKICRQIISGFEYVHYKKYLHRDIGPKNILIKSYANVHVVKIADFGLVKEPISSLTSIDSDFKGYFNDPILQEVGFSKYSIEYEIYAITKLIMYVLTGKEKTYNITENKYKEFYKKGMNKEIDRRFKDCKELKSAFNKMIKNTV